MDLLYVVLDLQPYGDLDSFLQKNSHILCAETLIDWTIQMLIGTHTLYSAGIYCTDIRPWTIRIALEDTSNGKQVCLKLLDIGSSTKQRKDTNNHQNQALFQKVEQFDQNKDASGRTDVYKIGLVAVYLFIWLDLLKNQGENSDLEPNNEQSNTFNTD